MKIDDFDPEEKKIIFHAVKYWQMNKASFEGKEYKICEKILSNWFENTQKKDEQND